MGKLFIPSCLVLAHYPRHLQPGNLLYHQHIHQSVRGVCIGHRIEAAAVKSAIAGADHCLVAVNDLAVHLDHIVLRNTLDHIDHRGCGVCPEAVKQRQALIPGDIRSDPGVQAYGANV